MPGPGDRLKVSVDRMDGGLNIKDSPSKIDITESPDCLNVAFDDSGSVQTRKGSVNFNTQAIGSVAIDGGISFNQSMVVWASGTMYRASGTTFVEVSQASGSYTPGNKIAAVSYQGLLFWSDGSNGPWKYADEDNFYNMGIDIPSAPTGASTGAGSLATGTYYYAISFVNSQAVEGEVGSASVAVTTTNSATVGLTDIPVGSSLAGVDARRVYRATSVSGPFRRVGEIADNSTTTFSDTTPNEEEGLDAVDDSTKPTPFNTIVLHRERLFFDDSSNRSLLRYTNFENPFISAAENFEPINNRDGENILAVASQDDFLTIFKQNNSWQIQTTDPSDDLTWQIIRIAANIGIVGPRAFASTNNGILFWGRRNNKLSGLHFLSGVVIIDVTDGKLRTKSISEKIEPDVLDQFSQDYWADIACVTYRNRLYTAYTRGSDTRNQDIYWLDLNRLGISGQPGSWAPWDGIEASQFFVHSGLLYAVDSAADGFVLALEQDDYNDNGAAINSYFWTKEIGGAKTIEDTFTKDFRELFLWFENQGDYNMTVRYRTDGDAGSGNSKLINLSFGTINWGSMVWGVDVWGGTINRREVRLPLGKTLGERIQVRFDNQNTADQAFKVHRLQIGMNIRRVRK